MTALPHRHRRWLGSVILTAILLVLIAAAIGVNDPAIALAVLLSVTALAVAFHFLLPGSEFFSIVFANSLGVYACIYVFFTSVNFPSVSAPAAQIGFVTPLIGFLAGVLWRRTKIRHALAVRTDHLQADLGRALVWLAPIGVIGAATFFVPMTMMTAPQQENGLLVAMTVIALIAVFASKDIAVFLLDTGILFEGFFANASRLVKPAFAFLTCYSFIVIIFGSIYTIIDRYSQMPNFATTGAIGRLSFAEGLYLSISTLSTVGFGDITALSPLARVLVSVETLSGILLLLFGLEAILASSHRRK